MLLLVVNLVDDSPHGSKANVPMAFCSWNLAVPYYILQSAKSWFKTCQGAREQGDSYAFAFECLLGDLALRLPCAHRRLWSQDAVKRVE